MTARPTLSLVELLRTNGGNGTVPISDGANGLAMGSHQAIDGAGTNTHAAIDTHIGDSTIHYTVGSIDHGSLNAASLLDDDHTQYSLVDGTRAYTNGITVNALPGIPVLTGTGTASTGSNVGISFAYTLNGNFTSVRGMSDTSTITAQSFSYSLFEVGSTFATTAGSGGVFSFLTGMLMAPTINNTGTGKLNNLTGFFHAPFYTAGHVGLSYGVYIQDKIAGAATLDFEIGGHFGGRDVALQVGTGAITGPTVGGRWYNDGDLVLGASAMSGTEKLRVVGDQLLTGNLTMNGGASTYLQAPKMTTAQRNTMTTAWGAAESGREWYNTSTNQGEAWNGTAIVVRY